MRLAIRLPDPPADDFAHAAQIGHRGTRLGLAGGMVSYSSQAFFSVMFLRCELDYPCVGTGQIGHAQRPA